MSRIKIVGILAIVILVVISIGALVLPYHTYYLALNEGIQNSYIDLPRYDDKYYRGKIVNGLRAADKSRINKDSWRKFPFESYKVPIPYQNPLFVFIPDFKFKDGKQRIGFNLVSNQAKFYLNFMLGGVQKFGVNYQTDWIFKLPYFNKYIRKKKPIELWEDILTKDIVFPKKGDLSTFAYADKIFELDLHEMVYNVFILKSRKLFFPKGLIEFSFYPEKNLAIVELESKFGGTKLEKIYLYRNGQLYTYYLETSLNQGVSSYLRWNYLHNVEYTQSSSDDAIGLYALFRKLEYLQKTNQEGLIHLFSAWSLNREKKDFMRDMIQYLERGPESNLVYLKPLYKYSLKNYKTTYSLRDERILESRALKQQRKKEEAARRLDDRTNFNPADQYEKQEDKARDSLQKAKDARRKKIDEEANVDEEEDVIEIN